jgi:8-oxo-dGTP pyrophosphatase MutT (NUDIX family)
MPIIPPRPAVPVPPDLDCIRRTLAVLAGGAVTAAADSPVGREGNSLVGVLPDRPAEGKQAAVALVLAGEAHDLHLCLIRRAEHELDRWSGHMALPGGRVDDDDPSARAAAIRETWEEVGLRLDGAACLGSLESQPVHAAGKLTELSLASFVFYLGQTLEPLTPSDEVAEAFWVPLRHLLDPANAAHRPTPRGGIAMERPAVLYQGHYIWGLTYRVLTLFFECMQLEIARPESGS